MENSAARQARMWEERFAAASTPLDLLGVANTLLRTRLVQWEAKAVAAVDRARDDKAKADAQERLNEAREDVERICGEVAKILAQTADQLDTTRR